jgi:hypothetical protein
MIGRGAGPARGPGPHARYLTFTFKVTVLTAGA